tara:strand:+ start:469 stop:1221 length:753 start_codon:yes stop_codon:yes gene_type:complete
MGNTTNFDTNNYELNLDSKKGVMIIHGFSSTTFETAPLAHFLADKGFRVSSRNLPGHATTIEDCNSTPYYEWFDFVDRNLAELSADCDEVYVVGLSMGGILGLYLAGFFPINKLVVAAPVISFKNPFEVNVLVRLFHRIVTKQKKGKHPSGHNTIKNYSGYDHYPLIALNEFRKMNDIVFKKLNRVKCPLLYVHSENDKMSLEKNIDLIMNNVSSEIKEKLIVKEASHHLFYKNSDQDKIFNTISDFLST